MKHHTLGGNTSLQFFCSKINDASDTDDHWLYTGPIHNCTLRDCKLGKVLTLEKVMAAKKANWNIIVIRIYMGVVLCNVDKRLRCTPSTSNVIQQDRLIGRMCNGFLLLNSCYVYSTVYGIEFTFWCWVYVWYYFIRII